MERSRSTFFRRIWHGGSWFVLLAILFCPSWVCADSSSSLVRIASTGDAVGNRSLLPQLNVWWNTEFGFLLGGRFTNGWGAEFAALSAPGKPLTPFLTLGSEFGNPKVAVSYLKDAFGPYSLDGNSLVRGSTANFADMLIAHLDGQNTALMIPGNPGPAGTWPTDLITNIHATSNGNVAIVAWPDSTRVPAGVFQFSFTKRQLTVVAKPGQILFGDWRCISFGPRAVTNTFGEVLFTAVLQNTPGEQQQKLILLRRDGVFQPIVSRDSNLPDGRWVSGIDWSTLSLTDTGAVLFKVADSTIPTWKVIRVYKFENGIYTPILVANTTPEGYAIDSIRDMWLTNSGQALLKALVLTPNGYRWALYQYKDKLSPVLAPGTTPPGVPGKFDINGQYRLQIAVNPATQPIIGTDLLDPWMSAIYRLEDNGQLTLLLSSGMATNLGTIAGIELWLPSLTVDASGNTLVNLRFQDNLTRDVIVEIPSTTKPPVPPPTPKVTFTVTGKGTEQGGVWLYEQGVTNPLFAKGGGAGGGRGVTVFVFDAITGKLARYTTIDTWYSVSRWSDVVNYILAQPDGVGLIVAIGDDAGLTYGYSCTHLPASIFPNPYAGEQLLKSMGSQLISSYCFRNGYVFATTKGKNVAIAEKLATGVTAATVTVSFPQ